MEIVFWVIGAAAVVALGLACYHNYQGTKPVK